MSSSTTALSWLVMASVRLESFVGGSLFDIMILVSGPVLTTSAASQGTERSVHPRSSTWSFEIGHASSGWSADPSRKMRSSASSGVAPPPTASAPSVAISSSSRITVNVPVNLLMLSFGCSISTRAFTRPRSVASRVTPL